MQPKQPKNALQNEVLDLLRQTVHEKHHGVAFLRVEQLMLARHPEKDEEKLRAEVLQTLHDLRDSGAIVHCGNPRAHRWKPAGEHVMSPMPVVQKVVKHAKKRVTQPHPHPHPHRHHRRASLPEEELRHTDVRTKHGRISHQTVYE